MDDYQLNQRLEKIDSKIDILGTKVTQIETKLVDKQAVWNIIAGIVSGTIVGIAVAVFTKLIHG